jgi:hypothetical protein
MPDSYDDDEPIRRERHRRQPPGSASVPLWAWLVLAGATASIAAMVTVVLLTTAKKPGDTQSNPGPVLGDRPLIQGNNPGNFRPPLNQAPVGQPLVPSVPAPEIEGTDQDGKSFKLSDYRGKVVLLDFWGNW